MASRQEVSDDMWQVLSKYGLEHYTDGVMDTLDLVAEWEAED